MCHWRAHVPRITAHYEHIKIKGYIFFSSTLLSQTFHFDVPQEGNRHIFHLKRRDDSWVDTNPKPMPSNFTHFLPTNKQRTGVFAHFLWHYTSNMRREWLVHPALPHAAETLARTFLFDSWKRKKKKQVLQNKQLWRNPKKGGNHHIGRTTWNNNY